MFLILNDSTIMSFSDFIGNLWSSLLLARHEYLNDINVQYVAKIVIQYRVLQRHTIKNCIPKESLRITSQ